MAGGISQLESDNRSCPLGKDILLSVDGERLPRLVDVHLRRHLVQNLQTPQETRETGTAVLEASLRERESLLNL